MPGSDPSAALVKRLRKIERVQERLIGITTRIRVQAETLTELLKLAEVFVERPTPPRAGRAKVATRGARRPPARGAATATRARTPDASRRPS